MGFAVKSRDLDGKKNLDTHIAYNPLARFYKSMLKVFSLVKVQFQFNNDKVIDMCIQCNRCKKTS